MKRPTTDEEEFIMSKLTQAHNTFVAMNQTHPYPAVYGMDRILCN